MKVTNTTPHLALIMRNSISMLKSNHPCQMVLPAAGRTWRDAETFCLQGTRSFVTATPAAGDSGANEGQAL